MSELKRKIKAWLDDFQFRHNFNLAWFIRYAIGGTVTVILEYTVMYLLLWWTLPWDGIVALLPEKIQASAADEIGAWALVVSNITSYIFNYFISKYWVFRSPDTRHSRDAALFFLSCVVNLILVSVTGRLALAGLELLPFAGKTWEVLKPAAAKTVSNIVAYVSVLLFKRFIIWNDTSKY